MHVLTSVQLGAFEGANDIYSAECNSRGKRYSRYQFIFCLRLFILDYLHILFTKAIVIIDAEWNPCEIAANIMQRV